MRTLLSGFVFCFVLPLFAGDDAQLTELLRTGQYSAIKPGTTPFEKAAYAFARYHLAPNKDMFDVARAAHEGGDALGTFVLMRCYQEGFGTRLDEAKRWKLNFELRERLMKIEKPSFLEAYMLSHLSAANAEGVISETDGQQMKLHEEFNDDANWKKLVSAAEQGLAQAMDDMGSRYQRSQPKKAYDWYDKAAKAGLASGFKNMGFMLINGAEDVPQDRKNAAVFNEQGAKRGDAYAAINMAVLFDRGWGVERSKVKAQTWLETAVGMDHHAGKLEKGLALLSGNYGLDVNASAGKALLQKAAETGHVFVLSQIAYFYYEGMGLEKNWKKAVEFAEAAFVQGDTRSAQLLAAIYSEGSENVPKNKDLEQYWGIQSKPSFAFALGIEKSNPEIQKRLDALNPFGLKVE